MRRLVLLRRIEAYLRRSRTSATRFGIEVARDPKLVAELRNGRIPRPRMQARIEAYLKLAEAAPKAGRCLRRR